MMTTIRHKIEPDVCTYFDEQMNNLTVEIALPGVSQQNIKLRVNSRCLILFAVAGDVHYAKYLSFHFPVVANQAIAVYGNGLLQIEMPLRT